ncbi:hypothetical protein [Cupriavidus pauculus]|uniref:hypothetical protein n=1 Tax=Cupriavidus pauculus TaxID=82633 RepID=UPI00385726C8
MLWIIVVCLEKESKKRVFGMGPARRIAQRPANRIGQACLPGKSMEISEPKARIFGNTPRHGFLYK